MIAGIFLIPSLLIPQIDLLQGVTVYKAVMLAKNPSYDTLLAAVWRVGGDITNLRSLVANPTYWGVLKYL